MHQLVRLGRIVDQPAAQDDVVARDDEAEPLPDPRDRAFELGIVEGHDVAGVLEHDVAVVLARGVDRLVARDAGVEAAQQAELVQRLQRGRRSP